MNGEVVKTEEGGDNKALIAQAVQTIDLLKRALQEKSVNAEVGEAIRNNNEWWEVSDIAKKVKFEIKPGKVLGRNQLYNFLMNTGMAHWKKDFVSGSGYYAPMQNHEDARRMKLGVTETKQENRQGELISNHRLLIGTEKGLPYIMKKLDEAHAEGDLEDLCGPWREAKGWS